VFFKFGKLNKKEKRVPHAPHHNDTQNIHTYKQKGVGDLAPLSRERKRKKKARKEKKKEERGKRKEERGKRKEERGKRKEERGKRIDLMFHSLPVSSQFFDVLLYFGHSFLESREERPVVRGGQKQSVIKPR